MREYFRYFRFPFIAVAVLAIVTLVLTLTSGSAAASGESMSTNTERTTTERVFDYADKLTDAEEEALREEIREAEDATKCDIVIVTLNESLVEYAAQYEDIIGSVPISECVMVYADNFYDEHKFGFDEAYGDGVLYLDNWYREADGGVYSWMSTCGSAMDRYSSAMIDSVINTVNRYVEEDPYKAYSAFIKTFREDMTGTGGTGSTGNSEWAMVFTPLNILVVSLVVALIFLIVNWFSKKGKRTTTSRTYVTGGQPVFRVREDRFLYKNVTKHKIQSSSGGGGGGGGSHRSAGGVSHGGGGGRR